MRLTTAVSGPNNGVHFNWKFDMPLLERHMADELRTFYHEAIAAQPDPGAPNHAALNDWIFSGTALEHGSRSQLT